MTGRKGRLVLGYTALGSFDWPRGNLRNEQRHSGRSNDLGRRADLFCMPSRLIKVMSWLGKTVEAGSIQ